MTEQISQFPAPPSFYKLYKDGPAAGPTPPSIPPAGELNVLAMPFDINESIYPSLEGVTRLYKSQPDGSVDVKQELLKLHKGQLFLFLDLLNALVDKPDSFHPIVAAILQNLENYQFLINTLRPDQARHTLEYILKLQIQEKREALERIKQQTHSLQAKIHEAAKELLAVGGDTAESAPPKLSDVSHDRAAAMDTT